GWGLEDDARATLAMIGEAPGPRPDASLTAIVLLAESGRGDEALAAAAALPDPAQRDSILFEIAIVHAEAGRVADGDAAVARFGPNVSSSERATVLAALGHDAPALAAVAQIASARDRRNALLDIVTMHARAGRRTAAIAAALADRDVPSRAGSLAMAALL